MILVLLSISSSLTGSQPLLTFFAVVLAMLSIYLRISIYKLVKMMLLIVVITILIYLPMTVYQIIIKNLSLNETVTILIYGKGSLGLLIMRSSIAGGFLILIPLSLGAQGIVAGLKSAGVSRESILLIMLTIRSIPSMIREGVRLLVGRRSRILVEDKGMLSLWRLFSTVAGELLIRSIYRGERLRHTLECRIWMDSPFYSNPISTRDMMIILMMLGLIIITMVFMEGL
jgi:energy-coupling factor transporter transmembrane protein EcfT